nr:TetR/AcrR family transcriptional regulator [Corynebacterium lactis]
MTRRTEARQRREGEILAAAAAIIAERGFHQSRLEDVGSAVGISGPALYRYFSGKEDLLAQILIDISIRLVDGGRAVLAQSKAEGWGPERTLKELLAHHVKFAVTEPDRIRVQEREGGNLASQERAKVRSLQRLYLEMWVDSLRALHPELTADQAQVKVQLVAGLINSSRHVVKWAGPEQTSDNTFTMALAALGIE